MSKLSNPSTDAYFAWLRKYLDDADTPQERDRRKAETFHITYGGGLQKLGKSRHAQPLAADFCFVDELEHGTFDFLGAMTGRFGNRNPSQMRKERRKRAQDERFAERNRKAGI